MKPFTSDLRSKIERNIKNHLDISKLLEDVDFKGENLSYAIIEDIHLIGRDISNTNFYNAIIGKEGKISSFINCNMQDCNFEKVKFLGKVLLHNSDARRCVFRNTYAPEAEYKFTDFRGAIFCHCVLRLGTEEGAGCKFDLNFFKDLTKTWGVDVEVKEKER